MIPEHHIKFEAHSFKAAMHDPLRNSKEHAEAQLVVLALPKRAAQHAGHS